MNVTSLIGKLAESPDSPLPLDLADVLGLAIHHTKGRGTPSALARLKVATGEQGHAYHFHSHQVARGEPFALYQTQPLTTLTWHAGAHNAARWGICVTGDYDATKWPDDLLDQVSELTALLSIWRSWWDPHEPVPAKDKYGQDITAPRIAGHRELPWSSKKVDQAGRVLKGCPGSAQSVVEIRDRVLRHLMPRRLWTPSDAAQALTEAGVVLPPISTPFLSPEMSHKETL